MNPLVLSMLKRWKMQNNQELKVILEGVLLAAGEPLSLARLQQLFLEHERPTHEALQQALQELTQEYAHKGIHLIEVASGFRFQTSEKIMPWVSRLWEEKPTRYSRAFLETLVLIAYRQPITRAEIEDVRGVAVSTHIIKSMLEREWVRVVGHRDVPGRPSLYATTKQFLDYFNLKSLDELPTLEQIKEMDAEQAKWVKQLEMELVFETNVSDTMEKGTQENTMEEVEYE